MRPYNYSHPNTNTSAYSHPDQNMQIRDPHKPKGKKRVHNHHEPDSSIQTSDYIQPHQNMQESNSHKPKRKKKQKSKYPEHQPISMDNPTMTPRDLDLAPITFYQQAYCSGGGFSSYPYEPSMTGGLISRKEVEEALQPVAHIKNRFDCPIIVIILTLMGTFIPIYLLVKPPVEFLYAYGAAFLVAFVTIVYLNRKMKREVRNYFEEINRDVFIKKGFVWTLGEIPRRSGKGTEPIVILSYMHSSPMIVVNQ